MSATWMMRVAVLTLALMSNLALAASDSEINYGSEVNPFDAVELNNLAVERTNRKDYAGAAMLLERAARLAPERQDIAENLAALQQWLRDNNAAAAAEAGDGILSEPPALWTNKSR